MIFAIASILAFADVAAVAPPETPAAFRDEGTHGRVDGDVSIVAGVGTTIAPRAPRAALDLRFRYLDTIGIFGTYEDASWFGNASDPRRVIVSGLELRPLFLARWLSGGESGNARTDLLVDSIGLEFGAVFAQPIGEQFVTRPGVQASLGLEIPLMARASGLFLGVHGGVRWGDEALSGGSLDGPNDRSLFLSLTLAWHQFVGTHVVDAHDTAPR
jgi:hypothetical protein